MIKKIKWETILMMENNKELLNKLNRSFSGIIKQDRNVFIILGGVQGIIEESEEKLNSIIKINIFSTKVAESFHKLTYPTKFSIQTPVECENFLFFFDDEQNPGIHKYDKTDGHVEYISFTGSSNKL